MDEQLLQDLYGIGSEEYYSEDDTLIKEAQAELIEAVADEAGVDLNEMDDEELEKFASYVLSPEAAELEQYEEAEYLEGSDPYEEADQMGRVMAHAYADEQMKIASAMEHENNYENALVKVAHSWDMLKVAKDEKAFKDRTVGELGAAAGKRISKMTGYRDIKRGLELTRDARGYMRGLTPEQAKGLAGDFSADSKLFKNLSAADQKAALRARITGRDVGTGYGTTAAYLDRKAGRRLLMRGGGKAAATLGVLGAAGYGVKRLRDR